jgi:transposase
LTTKLHLACDGKGRPLAVVLTPGQRHRQHPAGAAAGRDPGTAPRRAQPASHAPRPPHRRKGYSYERCRRVLRRGGIPHVIPERDDQRARRAAKPGRKPAFDQETYRRRNVVERCVNRLKQWRGIATRFEKRAAHYRAMVVIAALMIWLGS